MTTAPHHVHDFRGVSPKVCIFCGANSDEECAYGHPRTPENTQYLSDGRRRCGPCQRRKQTERRANLSPEELEVVRYNGRHAVNAARTRMKDTIFDHYGRSCACCGESEYAFLAIDHVNGGGNSHRRELSGKKAMGDHLYRWLVKNDFPEGFQTLCFNCNHAKHVLGACPHQTRGD